MGAIVLGGTYAGAWGFANILYKEAIFRDVADSVGDNAAIYSYLKIKYGL
jgi:hypothetical protein